jgi:hypothetical protein
MKLNVNNTEKVQAALDEVQGRSRERRYDAKDLQDIVEDFVQRMARLGVSRPKLAGCTVEFGGNYEPAKAYKYAFIGTIGCITFSASGAFLTALYRARCNRRTGATLADAAIKAIVKNAEKQDY